MLTTNENQDPIVSCGENHGNCYSKWRTNLKRMKYSNSSSLYDTYISSVGRPIYFTTLLFLEQCRFCTCKKTEDATVNQSEDCSNVIFIERICLQLNIILPSVHLTKRLPSYGDRREKLLGYLQVCLVFYWCLKQHQIMEKTQQVDIKSFFANAATSSGNSWIIILD